MVYGSQTCSTLQKKLTRVFCGTPKSSILFCSDCGRSARVTPNVVVAKEAILRMVCNLTSSGFALPLSDSISAMKVIKQTSMAASLRTAFNAIKGSHTWNGPQNSSRILGNLTGSTGSYQMFRQQATIQNTTYNSDNGDPAMCLKTFCMEPSFKANVA